MGWEKREYMPILEADLPAEKRIILANDTSDIEKARRTADVARNAGACFMKLGLELESATSWRECSELAEEFELDWVADAKLDDISATVAGAVRNIVGLVHPPVGITVHANAGYDSLKAAQEIAGEKGIMILGVTHLTSVDNKETTDTYRFLRKTLVDRRTKKMVAAEVQGAVCAPREVRTVLKKNPAYRHLVSMIPGTRSLGKNAHDQKNVITPEKAIYDGADLLVIGRQVTADSNPDEAFAQVTNEVQIGIEKRNQKIQGRAT
jgi:orotidine-5'-phosphate decarboxylase